MMFVLRGRYYTEAILRLVGIRRQTYSSLACLNVNPRVALVDERVSITANNLQPLQRVTVQAYVKEGTAVFGSCGHFLADEEGQIDVSQHASIGGTYKGEGFGEYQWPSISFVRRCEEIRTDLLERGEAWKNNAQILYLLGDDDGTWKTDHANIFMKTCPKEKRKTIEFVTYPGAGHLIEPPYMPVYRTLYHPVLGMTIVTGGHPEAHAAAQEDAWRRLLHFLQKHIA